MQDRDMMQAEHEARATENAKRRRISGLMEVLVHAHGETPRLARQLYEARMDDVLDTGATVEEATASVEMAFAEVLDSEPGMRELATGLPAELNPSIAHVDLGAVEAYVRGIVMRLPSWLVLRAFHMLLRKASVVEVAGGGFEVRYVVVASGDDAGEVAERVSCDPRTSPAGLLEALGLAADQGRA